MKCQEAHNLLPAYYNETLDEFTRIRIHHHLATCKKCTEDYEMWQRGEELIHSPQSYNQSLSASSSSSMVVMDHVMSRIYQEQKWANPSVKERGNYSKRFKLLFSFISTMILISLLLIFATTLIPQYELDTERKPISHVNEWEVNKILLQAHATEGETSMQFKVVASLNDPIIYLLPGEETAPPYGIIFSIFGILCVILGMSWLTRV